MAEIHPKPDKIITYAVNIENVDDTNQRRRFHSHSTYPSQRCTRNDEMIECKES